MKIATTTYLATHSSKQYNYLKKLAIEDITLLDPKGFVGYPVHSAATLKRAMNAGNIRTFILGNSNNNNWVDDFISLKMKHPQSIVLFPVYTHTNKFEIQDALNLGFDGIFISEFITNIEVRKLIQKLEWRNQKVISKNNRKVFDEYRNQIDQLDEQILQALIMRVNLVTKLAVIKKDANQRVFQPKRWQEILDQTLKIANDKNIPAANLLDVISSIHKSAIEIQLQHFQSKEVLLER